ncbi:hypothetical protein NLX83_22555 [Allokutzneria sp. A3M-2-11 16]|uniref:hypothetical protein n=1 Tax=Allokutzneria sp. A3M-2-11 16 TaxID=2962043 RepID=UPI0020B6DF9B|nr:hypothetical protein [Allokutzneria sp. A3M-2-11 16]MCP3802050.1 hypothetical protein [Allokutzneria sp. A3M-2-11 16]
MPSAGQDLDPERIETKQDLAEQLTALRELAGGTSLDALARMAFPDSRGRANVTTVRNWFAGTHAPRDSDALCRMVRRLAKSAGLPDPDATVRGFANAFDRIADARLRQRQARVPGAKAAPSPKPRWRWWPVLVAAVLMLSGGVGFAVARYSYPPPSVLAFPSCAEAFTTGHSSGYLVLTAETGPPGNPHPNRRIELRIQKDDADAWHAYAYLAQSPNQQDRAYLLWSYQQSGTPRESWRECGGELSNKVQQTPGLLSRDRNGWPRWFRACVQVPPEDQIPGRGREICTSATRADD